MRLTAKVVARFPITELKKPKFLTRAVTPLWLHRGGQPDPHNDRNNWVHAAAVRAREDVSDTESSSDEGVDIDAGSDEEYADVEFEYPNDHQILAEDMGGNDFINAGGRMFLQGTIHVHCLNALRLIFGFYSYFIRQTTRACDHEILDPLLIQAVLQYTQAVVTLPEGKGYIDRVCDGLRKIMLKAQSVRCTEALQRGLALNLAFLYVSAGSETSDFNNI